MIVLVGMGSSAFAQSEKIVAEIASVNNTIKSVQLTDTGLLKIEKYDNQNSENQLSTANATKMLAMVQELGNAELITDHHPFTCMMILPANEIENLYVADGKTGELRLTLSMASCALHDYTHPKEDYLKSMASELKSAMQVLAQQLVND